MKFGIAFPAFADIYKEAREVEHLGFDSFWLFDSPMVYSDVYVALALAALHTARIRLGTAVAVARNRIAPVTAHSIATINQLALGRVALGFATGNTARRAMGMAPVPLAEFRRECVTIRALLRGETALYHEGGRQSAVRLVHQRHGFVCVEPPVPLYVGAGGEKALAIAGEVGDGLIWAGGGAAALRSALARVRAARSAAGGGKFAVVAMLGAYVTGRTRRPTRPPRARRWARNCCPSSATRSIPSPPARASSFPSRSNRSPPRSPGSPSRAT